MASIGPEQVSKIAEKHQIANRAAHIPAHPKHDDTDLAEVLARWDSLSGKQRAEILKIVRE